MEEKITFGMLWRNAGEKLRGRWKIAVGVSLLYTLIEMAVSLIAGDGSGIASLLLSPLGFGISLCFLRLDRGEQIKVEMLFEPFRDYGRILWAYLRPTLFVILWMLCFIIPGIIAGFRYYLTNFIVLDHPGMPVKDAMELSCRMMKGYKFKIFCYNLLIVLIGMLFGAVTLGIGLIWYVPFCFAFFAGFYNRVKAEKCPEPIAENMTDETDADAPAPTEIQ